MNNEKDEKRLHY